jgi:hypothetical protein
MTRKGLSSFSQPFSEIAQFGAPRARLRAIVSLSTMEFS